MIGWWLALAAAAPVRFGGVEMREIPPHPEVEFVRTRCREMEETPWETYCGRTLRLAGC